MVFTHCDLQSKNILVYHGRLSALLDFEIAGFMPEWREYYIAWRAANEHDGWMEEVDRVLEPYPNENDAMNRLVEVRPVSFLF